MRTRVIPAQITTVEDKIAGNFSLTQIIILLMPVLFTAVCYALLPPSMKFVWYKLSLILLFSIICTVLSVRIKGQIVATWIFVIARYNLRPKYYIFNKNELFARKILKTESIVEEKAVKKAESNETSEVIKPSIKELLQLDHLIDKNNFNLSYKTAKKGGLHVAFEKITK